MKHTLRYIVIFVLSIIIASFLVFTSLAFEKTSKNISENIDNSKKITFSLPLEESGKIQLDADGNIQYNSLLEDNVPEGGVFAADFGRLTTGFFISQSSETPISSQIVRQNKIISIEKIRGIFSWYDPFDVYTLVDNAKTFSFKQITSGSFYVSHEDDGTIVFYSVDMVGELSFLYADSVKTKMILFPGMYFRFDPVMNANMSENADLLRIIQTQGGSDKNTSISFINPRIEIAGAKQDIIVPFFILKQSASKLFDYLRLASKERVRAVDALKQYTTSVKKNFSIDSAIQNPTKKMYRLLGELQIIFSQAINNEISVEEFRSRIDSILIQTEEFELENTAKKMIEQFLIDGRFALFMGSNDANIHYQKLYDEAANILKITPTTGKGKMFQVLSNIFSRNILEDKLVASQISVDTIAVLNNTLSQAQNEIANGDYFDLSLYAFLILRTMPDVQDAHKKAVVSDVNTQKEKMSLGLSIFSEMLLSRVTMEQESIYKMYSAIFNATQRYVRGISESDQKNNAQTALATDFYSPMLYLLVNSLYQTYTVNENNEIYLAVAYVNRGVPELSTHNHDAIVNNLTNTYSIMNDIYNRNITNNTNMSAVSKMEIEKYLAQLKGFIDMMSETGYRDYQQSPYIAEENTVFPKYNTKTYQLERKSASNIASATVSTEKNSATTPVSGMDSVVKNETIVEPKAEQVADANIAKISKLINTLLLIKTENEQISLMQGTDYQIDFVTQNKGISFIFDVSNNILSGLKVTTDYEIHFEGKMPITQLRIILANFSMYETQIAKIFQNNSNITSKTITINTIQKQIKINEKIFPLQ